MPPLLTTPPPPPPDSAGCTSNHDGNPIHGATERGSVVDLKLFIPEPVLDLTSEKKNVSDLDPYSDPDP
jgi:hypothetical protein